MALIFGLLFGLTLTATAADKVRFNLDWVVFGRHTGYFTALGKGFYKQNGIEAIVKRGYGSTKAIALMAQGQSDYTFADLGALVLARANEGVPVKAIGVVYARTPHAVHYLEDAGIGKPSDLAGRRVAASAGASITQMFSGFQKAAGIEGSVKMQMVEGSTLNTLLLSKRTDGMLDYVFNTVLLNKLGKTKGLKAKYFLYSDAGMIFYGNALLVPDKTIASNPEQVRRFLKATFMGLEYSFKHPQEAVDILRKFNPQVDREAALGENALVKQMMSSPEALKNGMGYMAPKKIAGTIETMRRFMNLKKALKPEDVYTNGFLPGIKIPN
jgi:NitT/TauT family transport system substrate-binding protein